LEQAFKPPILKLLFQKSLVNKSLVDKDKNTALHFATIQKNYDAIILLLENGMDVDAQNADGRTSLMLASLTGDERITEYLLEYNADKLIKDNWIECKKSDKDARVRLVCPSNNLLNRIDLLSETFQKNFGEHTFNKNIKESGLKSNIELLPEHLTNTINHI
jgi:ankyrin repeat protein